MKSDIKLINERYNEAVRGRARGKSNTYKLVRVYTSYDENSIGYIETTTTTKDLESFMNERVQQLRAKEHEEEFLYPIGITHGIGAISLDEEHVELVIPANSPMFNFVDIVKDADNNSSEWAKWSEFMNSMQF